jgi:hypothetical protein
MSSGTRQALLMGRSTQDLVTLQENAVGFVIRHTSHAMTRR